MDAEDSSPDAVERLESVANTARHENDIEVELLALDALARAYAQSGDFPTARQFLERGTALMPRAQHLLDESDRLDRDKAQELVDAASD